MTLDATTWMLATLNECCERYFGWMLNECKGTSGPSSSGLWYPGALSVYFFFFFFRLESLSITQLFPYTYLVDWVGTKDTCKNE